MCGIAGLVGVGGEDTLARVQGALGRLAHRGPDGTGLYEGDGVVLGMQRLAIIDVAHGHQPIYNEDQSVAVVCNGELYNYIEGFRDLESRGHRFQSQSDINLIPHYYEERGRDAFAELRGMFAAAVWDVAERRLTLARDRVGKKPLFYARVGAGLAFASELPALLALLDTAPDLSHEAIADYLRLGYVPHPETIYRGVSALTPGTTLTFEPGQAPLETPYWQPSRPPAFAGSRRDALDALDGKLAEAVTLRLRSDVPVGLFLSGGIDSGLVASYAAQADAKDLLCFVVEVDDPELNEAPAARATASRLGLPVETIPLSFAPLDAIERVAGLYGQPFGDSSAVPSYFVARAASGHRKVVLNGDGGDEVFAGYRRYWPARAAPGLLPLTAPFRRPLGALGRRLARGGGGRRSASGFAARTLRGLAASTSAERYLLWSGDLFDHPRLKRCFPELAGLERTLDRLARLRRDTISGDSLRELMGSDYRLNLPDDLLAKMDMATMAHSLEARSPLLDVPLAEFSWSVPDRWLLGATRTKPLLRDLAGRRLPPAVARAPKRGFEVPVARWLETDLRDMVGDLLLSADSRVSALGVRGPIEDFVRGADDFPGNRPQAVWCLLVLELFLRAPTPSPARP